MEHGMDAVLHIKPKRGKPQDIRAALGVFLPRENDRVTLPGRKGAFRVTRVQWRYEKLTRRNAMDLDGFRQASVETDRLTPYGVEVWMEAV